MEHALDGIRVLDLSRALAGPFTTMTLGDLGADVIKVETPNGGDNIRGFPPFWNGESCYFLSTNRNKRGITLNLQSEGGRDIVRRLVARVDIVVENFRTGTMEGWGLGWDDLRAINPRLIYCAVSAVGRDGPEADRAGVDLLMQAYGGLMSITGEEDGPPVRVGTTLIDLATGANAVQGILAALYVRERTGHGQRIDVSLLASQVTWLTYHAVSWLGTGQVPKRMGSKHPSVAPYGAYPAKDGWLVVAAAGDALWRRFATAIGRADLIDDPRFVKTAGRVANRAELDAILIDILAARTPREWSAIMDEAGVPCSPINTIDTVLTLPQVLHQGLVIDLPSEAIPNFRMQGFGFRLSETPLEARLPPPLLGQHTAEVLGELGFSPAEIEQMGAAGVV